MKVSKTLEINAHSGAIYTIDGSYNSIYTGSGDCFVAKWNGITGEQEKFSIRTEKSIYKIKLLEEAKYLLIGLSSGSLHIIDLIQKKELKHYTQHKTAIFEIIENVPKNQFYTTDSDGNLAIWSKTNWELLLFLPLRVGKIRHGLLTKDGNLLFLACQNGSIKVFETSHFNEIDEFQGHAMGTNFLTFYPNELENKLISGGKDGYLSIWNTSTFQKILSIPAHNFGIYSMCILNNGNNLISISRDKSLKLWDLKTLSVLQKIERKHGGHSHAINDIYKKNEFEFVTVGDDKRIISWKLDINI